eukprot:TRINITY_DN772_c0_g1_i2.p2 TRINITY_DN772_c0_g1~~TRINITY_DN772_c0_g1_i2.p2  ORF type:complete len:323 (+),score=143.78 TRINITY_DN772_c0_g1_i2:105-1073(+)
MAVAASPLRRFYDRAIAPRVLRVTSNKHVARVLAFLGRETVLQTIARWIICSYFIALAYTEIQIWWKYRPGPPYLAFLMLPCSVLVAVNLRVTRAYIFCLVLAVLAFLDASEIIQRQLIGWWYHGYIFYINELMVKKFSMLGAIVMVAVADPFFKKTIDSTTKALQGLIGKEDPKHAIGRRTSIILLVVRLLMSSLFLYVGYGEIKRQMEVNVHLAQHSGHGHHHANEDGHNQMWLKVLQFLLSLPFVIGFKTKWAASALAACLFTEAFVYWSWWSTRLGIRYAYHAFDHFMVNVGVAGGLMLLLSFGAGKYTVDQLMKKKQ